MATKKKSIPVQPVKKDPALRVKKSKVAFIHTVGRRKTAVARVRLFEGKDEIKVNGQPITKYWPGTALETLYMEPFRTTNTQAKYTATVKVSGSGTKGQIGAFIHAVARALSEASPERFRTILKKRGFITRDPRMKETRKIGTGGRARAQRQSPKR